MTLMGLSLFQCSSLLPREGCSTIQPSHSFNCSRMFLSSGNISIVHQISLRPFSWITPIAPSGTRASGKISWPSGKQTCVPLLALLSSSHVVIFVSIFLVIWNIFSLLLQFVCGLVCGKLDPFHHRDLPIGSGQKLA